MTPNMTENHEISTFRETSQGDSRKLLGYIGSVPECVRVSGNDFRTSPQSQKNNENVNIFWIFMFSWHILCSVGFTLRFTERQVCA